MSKLEKGDDAVHQGVRFASHDEEIEPEDALRQVETLTGAEGKPREELGSQAQQDLRSLSRSLKNTNLQPKTLEHLSYEPVSLPASRVRWSTLVSNHMLTHGCRRPRLRLGRELP